MTSTPASSRSKSSRKRAEGGRRPGADAKAFGATTNCRIASPERSGYQVADQITCELSLMNLPFIDLAAQQARIRDSIDSAIATVLNEGQYISGRQVAELEKQLAEFCGAKHCLSCANGTDAIQLALMAMGIGQGDAVFVPSFTFAATAEVVPLVGATPVFVDVLPDTFNMDPQSLKRAIAHARELGLRPACVIPVDLFGLPADFDELTAIARDNDLKLVAAEAPHLPQPPNRALKPLCDLLQ